MNVEVIGTTASLLVLLSFLCKGEKWIRVVNVIGAMVFVVYGLLVGAFSVCFLNSCLVLVHIYKLIKLTGG